MSKTDNSTGLRADGPGLLHPEQSQGSTKGQKAPKSRLRSWQQKIIDNEFSLLRFFDRRSRNHWQPGILFMPWLCWWTI